MDSHTHDRTGPAEIGAAVRAVLSRRASERMSSPPKSALRGEYPLAAVLAKHGSDGFAGLAVSSADFAEGLLNLKDDAAALMEWAGFIVTAADSFTYDETDIAGCRRLLDYIWQIPFGSGLCERALVLAAAVRCWPRRAA